MGGDASIQKTSAKRRGCPPAAARGASTRTWCAARNTTADNALRHATASCGVDADGNAQRTSTTSSSMTCSTRTTFRPRHRPPTTSSVDDLLSHILAGRLIRHVRREEAATSEATLLHADQRRRVAAYCHVGKTPQWTGSAHRTSTTSPMGDSAPSARELSDAALARARARHCDSSSGKRADRTYRGPPTERRRSRRWAARHCARARHCAELRARAERRGIGAQIALTVPQRVRAKRIESIDNLLFFSL